MSDQASHIRNLQNKVATTRGVERAARRDPAVKSLVEQNKALAAELAAAKAENEQLRVSEQTELVNLRKAADDLRSQLVTVCTDRDAFRSQLATMSTSLDLAKSENAQLCNRATELEAEVAALKVQPAPAAPATAKKK